VSWLLAEMTRVIKGSPKASRFFTFALFTLAVSFAVALLSFAFTFCFAFALAFAFYKLKT
jgi:hypothetical protein